MKNGDRVKDKFKVPKPGDETVTGTVVDAEDNLDVVNVMWDDGRCSLSHTNTLEQIEEEDDGENG